MANLIQRCIAIICLGSVSWVQTYAIKAQRLVADMSIPLLLGAEIIITFSKCIGISATQHNEVCATIIL